jgi:mannitol-specific phosphotransferase system IIBC component
MTTLWHLAHIAGFTLWLGGGLAGMLIGLKGRAEDRATQAVIVRLLAGIHRIVMFPGILLAVISGGALSAAAANAGAPSSWLMLMQIAGVIAAILVLFVSLPALGRLNRIPPTGDTAPRFDALRKRQAMSGMIAGILGLLALIGGVLHKY